MKTTTLAQRADTLPETSFTAYSSRTRVQRPGLIKTLPSPAQPDEKTIQRLNELAARYPFCRPYKAPKHDTL